MLSDVLQREDMSDIPIELKKDLVFGLLHENIDADLLMRMSLSEAFDKGC